MWREIRTEFKKSQLLQYKGKINFVIFFNVCSLLFLGLILNRNFVAILKHFDLKISNNEIELLLRTFRSVGMQDVVQHDEFLKVCLLIKNSALENE